MRKTFSDQMGRKVDVSWPPQRIISIVPSQTELLWYLGLEEEVVGITKFCVHPENWFRNKQRVGGTKKLDFNKIAALKPDLIIGNKEENEEQQVKQLMEIYPVWMSDIHTLDDALAMMVGIGELTNREEKAKELMEGVKKGFDSFKSNGLTNKKVAYFIWREPYMVAGGDTFLNDILKKCKLENVFAGFPGRYPEVSKEDIVIQNPEIIILSSEPFPFSQKHINEFKELIPTAKIILADGEYFSWYGSRLLEAPAYFNKVLAEI